MSTLNIGGNEKDRFYRYKMPKLIAKIEGRGNGIKTVVPNMSDIARSLGRPPAYATKFFGCELGAQVKCDEKNDRYIVNGAHEAAKLQELLDAFIKKFVLCGECNNPETDLIIPKNEKIIRDCKACGQRSEVDMRHKLVTFILKNPPNPPKGKSKKDKSDKTKKSKSENGPVSPTTNSSDGSDDELTRRIREEAARLPTAEETGVDEDDWAVDTSAAAVRERMKDLEANVTTLFGIAKDKEQVLQKLVLGLFDDSFKKDASITKQIKKRAKIFQKFVQTTDDQHILLGAISMLVGVERRELFEGRIICKILMELYQNDILCEEVIQAWIEGKDSASYKALFKKTADAVYVDEIISKELVGSIEYIWGIAP
ncbi:3130_t:CDS:2 [Paraglomus occultum]|uniref:3130_t:CDS:1 n=1 Tax=Paraglomus occultum TaxID=144539 RepID=A0A9N8W757_9GLOM|nr:3130_t:CDS:2 [Paraglomus occultum]